MNINYLIELLGNRLSSLNLAKDQAFSAGDLERINTVDNEILGVQDTLTKLKLLQTASQEAAATNSTLVEAMKLPVTTITDGSIECLKEYDISTYATDPLHEQKIVDILRTIGLITTREEIDAYISNEAIGSPITGTMVVDAANKYVVDIRLMLALMELDSRFGTAGVAVSTFNPGNIGNTGSITRTFETWTDGVSAVAQWLYRHRIEVPEPVVEPVIVTPPPVLDDINDNNDTDIPSIDTATTTPPVIIDDTSTSTPPFTEATSTPGIIPPTDTATSTEQIIPPSDTSTTTPPVIDIPSNETSTTTPSIELEIPQTDTPVITPETDATSTPILGWFGKSKKRRS